MSINSAESSNPPDAGVESSLGASHLVQAGQKRVRRKVKNAVEVPARTLSQNEEASLRESLLIQGLNPLAIEINVALRIAGRRPNLMNIRRGTQSFRALKQEQFDAMVDALCIGEPLPWKYTEAFLSDAGVERALIITIGHLWVKTLLARNDLALNDVYKRDVKKTQKKKVGSRAADHKLIADIPFVMRHLEEEVILLKLQESGELDRLATDGDSVYRAGSPQRNLIIRRRHELGVNLHHANDIVDEHVPAKWDY